MNFLLPGTLQVLDSPKIVLDYVVCIYLYTRAYIHFHHFVVLLYVTFEANEFNSLDKVTADTY